MAPHLGHLFLLLALGAALFCVGSTAWAYRAPQVERAAWLDAAFRAILANWALISLASLSLIYLFVSNDFSVDYVAAHSNKAQALTYKLSAFWGGQQGSLLMWAWMLGAFASGVALTGRRSRSELSSTAAAAISVVTVFFVGLIAFASNPFALLRGATPQDGLGLNPLLQNPWMQIHPPTLYLGYVGCVVPWAFALAALFHRRFDADWVAVVRRWTLFPWIILTLGIIMGGAWAYETLGWGGYWAWDPVENASLMPWLTATAFLHSIIIQGKRGLLKSWNVTLATLTFLLSIFGTFLTRSGVVSSVHSFAESNIGPYFLGFLALMLVTSFGCIIWRRDELATEGGFESPISREGAFLLNNWILLASAFAVLWGTVFPALSEAVSGQTVSVGAPYFNRVMTPLGLLLLALTGVGPLMAWRKMSLPSLWRTFKLPVIIALIFALPLWWLAQQQTGAATSFVLACFVCAAIGLEFWRGAKARNSVTGESLPQGFFNLFVKNRRRYGGYVVHLGIVMFFVGVTGSSAFKIETEPITLKPGQRMTVGEYVLTYEGLRVPKKLDADKQSDVAAGMAVARNGVPLKNRDGSKFYLEPSIQAYKTATAQNTESQAGQPAQTARRPAIFSNTSNDLYLALIGYDMNAGTAEIKAYLNPLVMWIWLSCVFFVGGTLISILPDKRQRTVAAPASSRAKSAARVPAAVQASVAAEAPGGAG